MTATDFYHYWVCYCHLHGNGYNFPRVSFQRIVHLHNNPRFLELKKKKNHTDGWLFGLHRGSFSFILNFVPPLTASQTSRMRYSKSCCWCAVREPFCAAVHCFRMPTWIIFFFFFKFSKTCSLNHDVGDRKHASSHRRFHVAACLSVISQYIGVCLDYTMMPADGCLREMSLPPSSADIQGESQVPEHTDLMLSDMIWSVPVGIHYLSRSPWVAHRAHGKGGYPKALGMAQAACTYPPSVFLEIRWPLGTHRICFRMLVHLRLATQLCISVRWMCFNSGSNTHC